MTKWPGVITILRLTAEPDLGQDGGIVLMKPLEKFPPTYPNPNGRSFWIGIGLIIVSFVIMAFYFAIPFLPVSLNAKAGIVIAISALSWGLFFVGSLFTGKEGFPFLKQQVRTRFRRSRGQ